MFQEVFCEAAVCTSCGRVFSNTVKRREHPGVQIVFPVVCFGAEYKQGLCFGAADKLRISAEDVETGGEAEEEITVDYGGDEMSIGFNANYLLDALRQVDCEEAKFSFGTADSAGIIEPIEKSENEDFLMLLMPVRLP